MDQPEDNKEKQPVVEQNGDVEKDKKYFLSKDEKVQLEGRYAIVRQRQYELRCINMEIQSYIRYSILERLGIGQDKNYILSKDNTYITLPGGEDDPVKTK
jgi:hypothetical protein